jgi:hypothetical protein
LGEGTLTWLDPEGTEEREELLSIGDGRDENGFWGLDFRAERNAVEERVFTFLSGGVNGSDKI